MTTYLHIGYPKTGTKTLQNGLFENLADITFLGMSAKTKPLAPILERIKHYDSIEYPADETRRIYNNILDGITPLKDTILISNEDLTTANLFDRKMVDRGLVAERLKSVLGPAKIMIVIRSQLTAIPSLYTQLCPLDGYSKPRFEQTLKENLNNFSNGFLSNYKYDKLIKRYEECFGSKNIGVFVFEEIIDDPFSYYSKICSFMEIDLSREVFEKSHIHMHDRVKSGAIAFTKSIQFYERFRKSYTPWLKPSKFLPFYNFRKLEAFFGRSGKKFIPMVEGEWVQTFHELFAEGNRELVECRGLDLGKFGYPL